MTTPARSNRAFPRWEPPVPDASKPWTLPRPGDERRTDPPDAEAWWDAVRTGDHARVSAWLDGPSTYAYNDPRGALLDACNEVGQTALGWLVENHDLTEAAVALLPVLFTGNRSPMLGSHTVFTHHPPFWAALEHPDERVARTMWDHREAWVSNPCWLHDAVDAGVDERALQRLIAWGMPVNEQTVGKGDTVLHAVVRNWNTLRFAQPGLVDLLLDAGADPRIVNRDNVSALGAASARARDHSSLESLVDRWRTIARHRTERDALNRAMDELETPGSSGPAPVDPASLLPSRKRL